MLAVLAMGVCVSVDGNMVGVEVERREDDASLSRCKADVERGLRAMRDKEGRRDCIWIARRPIRIQQRAMSREEESLDCGIIGHYLR